MKVLITGGAGFIGSHLGERLLQDGHAVVAADNFEPFYPVEQKQANVKALEAFEQFELVNCDIRDREAVEGIFSRHQFDAVVHIAAKAGVRPSIADPEAYFDVNVRGTNVILEAMRKAGVTRLLFASSSSVYGNQEKKPFSESDDVGFPISPYAASKRSGELLCHVYHHLYGFDIACLRFFTVYGPRQRPDLAIRKFTELALNQQPIPIFGDGLTRRDYTFVGDLVTGLMQVLAKPGQGFEIFNLGCGKPVTLLELIQALEGALDTKIQLNFLSKQPGDVEETHADIEKARRVFGYEPQTSLQTGIRAFVDWFVKQKY